MTFEQGQIFVILVASMGLFIWGRWRHDVVALGALLTCVIAGLVPEREAFSGFGHPAVITVASVLVLSHGLQRTGAVNRLAQRLLPSGAGVLLSIAALTSLGALLSAFMNNVGALALLMPIALQIAARLELPPGRVLMPLAFGTILGGMTTLIGTPPNLIVSSFRAQHGDGPFAMFDFSPIGVAVALAGVLFITLLGWRLVPKREVGNAASFDTGHYLTEARVKEGGKAQGKTLREIEQLLDEADAQVVAMVRNKLRLTAPNPRRVLQADDVLVIEADPGELGEVLSQLDLLLEAEREAKEAEQRDDKASDAEKKGSNDEDRAMQELLVKPDSSLIGRSASSTRLRSRYSINLLAISRQSHRSIKRLRSTQIQSGDVLLMQGSAEDIGEFASDYDCVPLAARAINIPDPRQANLALGIMLLAIGAAAFGLLSAAIAFASGVLAYMLLRLIPLRAVYESIDWPVIVLLGALIPVAGAMSATGAADLLARLLMENLAQGNAIITLTLLLVVTMTLSDFMNNAATAAVMCPIALSAASQLGVSPDSLLMAVAIGASCSFLTPIGHQNNTLILSPGGFRFGDYWRLGLPLEMLVVLISVPMLLWIWPL
ncbi:MULTISPECIES: SLC13 family permease [Pseudomonadaceae]|uniref:Di-and tricarboxylate transporter n=1 Tax=Ectopseudomonas alcaliphila TaxID=101564 RepID=A0A1G6YT13_9GAMM|nr:MULTISPECIES: SLC13 family permease [Pseudomonas]PKM32215.1 MAG: SLC13 family permease [Gammaproteobacteria bacterium HGW-Gammaproteobacteria-12]MDP9938611.1 di/tricarboxylate transporter [Pseudomonas sp. 3400]MDR7010834.1 di/tricarboxylate transporter [Pseudomonas alcaliphila]MDX5992644.1 SLC13 family permease [Pseudomonas alcaliphila]SDD93498.1 Di-and tricarboxylate transporter [Pseudomonas alcaliphila]